MPDQDNLEDALSLERFGRYLSWAGGDRDCGVALYTLNAKLSEALYLPLQGLELALRNRVHTVMTDLMGERWFDGDGVLAGRYQPAQVEEALAHLAEDGKVPTPGRIVAALSFSFWTAMVSPTYEDLWRRGLNRIALTEDGKRLGRKKLSAPLTPIRLLRNRVAHHEPILHWDVTKHHRNIVQITRWLSPAVADWISDADRFPEVYGSGYTLDINGENATG